MSGVMFALHGVAVGRTVDTLALGNAVTVRDAVAAGESVGVAMGMGVATAAGALHPVSTKPSARAIRTTTA